MGHRAYSHRRTDAGDGMRRRATSIAKLNDARLRKLGQNQDTEYLLMSLEHYGAKVSTLLLPLAEQLARSESGDTIQIPVMLADEIAAFLFSLLQRKPGPRKSWSADIEDRAMRGLLDDKPVNVLAREISQETGLAFSGTRRRLQEMKHSAQLKLLKMIPRHDPSPLAVSSQQLIDIAVRHLQQQAIVARHRAK